MIELRQQKTEIVYEIRDEAPHDHFFQTPNLVDDLHLSVYAFRLYSHLRRVAGERGKCWQGTRTLADACHMSEGSVSHAKEELCNTVPPLIRINIEKGAGGYHHIITITDIWLKNHNRYTEKSVHQVNTNQESVHHMNANGKKRSPGERKKNPIFKNNQKEEERAGAFDAGASQAPFAESDYEPEMDFGRAKQKPSRKEDLPPYKYPDELQELGLAFETRLGRCALNRAEHNFWINGSNGPRPACGLKHFKQGEITTEEINAAFDAMQKDSLTIKSPNSLFSVASSIHQKRVHKQEISHARENSSNPATLRAAAAINAARAEKRRNRQH